MAKSVVFSTSSSVRSKAEAETSLSSRAFIDSLMESPRVGAFPTAPSAAAGSTTAAGSPTAAGPTAAGTPGAKPKAKKVKYPCGKCDGEVTCGVACNSCDIWFHDKCVDGMSKEYFDNCKKAYELFGFTAFLCKICKKVFNVLNKSLKDVKNDLKSMQDRVMVLEQEKVVLALKLERIEKGTEKVTARVEGVVKDVASGMEKAKEEVKKDVKTEMSLREANGSNIAIYGIEETKEEDEEKWREGELKKVMEITAQIGVQINGEIAIRYRAGKPREQGAKPRPLIVGVVDNETRAKIFQFAPRLSRAEKTKRVFISPDLTVQQREEDRKAETARKEEAAKRTEQAKKEKRMVKHIVVGARGRRRIIEVPDVEEVRTA